MNTQAGLDEEDCRHREDPQLGKHKVFEGLIRDLDKNRKIWVFWVLPVGTCLKSVVYRIASHLVNSHLINFQVIRCTQ